MGEDGTGAHTPNGVAAPRVNTDGTGFRLPRVLRDEAGTVIYQRPRPIEDEVIRRLDSLVASKGHLPEERILAEMVRMQNELARSIGSLRAEMGALAAQVDRLGNLYERHVGALSQQIAAVGLLAKPGPPAVEAAPPPPPSPPPAPAPPAPRFSVIPRHTVQPPPTVTAESVTGAPERTGLAPRERKLKAKDVETALDLYLKGEWETWESLAKALGVTPQTLRARAYVVAERTGRAGDVGKVTAARKSARGRVIGSRAYATR